MCSLKQVKIIQNKSSSALFTLVVEVCRKILENCKVCREWDKRLWHKRLTKNLTGQLRSQPCY